MDCNRLSRKDKVYYIVIRLIYIIMKFLALYFIGLIAKVMTMLAPTLEMSPARATLHMSILFLLSIAMLIVIVFLLGLIVMDIQTIYDIIRNKAILVSIKKNKRILIQLRYMDGFDLDWMVWDEYGNSKIEYDRED